MSAAVDATSTGRAGPPQEPGPPAAGVRGPRFAPGRRVGDLQLQHDPDFERREWIVQRVGWCLLVGIVLAALLGFFGGAGAFCGASVQGGGAAPLQVEYERTGRLMAPTTLRVRFAVAASGEAVLTLASDWGDHVQLQQVTPRPVRVVHGSDTLRYEFAADPGVTLTASFHATFQRIGVLHGAIGRPGGEPVRFTQFVYP